ncbi:MAG: glycosyltransferase family 9 protein [Candidatus Omnitrophica bacterium]|nr:glycosyltransferase family 9 protein [Candidatus Omnitrophota bacterium]
MIKTGAAGDIVLSSPFFQSFKLSFPDSEIHLLTKKEYHEIVEPCPVFNHIHWLKNSFRENLLKMNQEDFDLVVNLQGSLRTELLVAGMRAKVKAGLSDRLLGKLVYRLCVPTRLPGDIRNSQFSLLRRLGAEKITPDFHVWVDKVTEKHFPEFLAKNHVDISQPTVVIHPGASQEWPTKRWPAEYFAQLAASLKSTGYQVIIVGTREETKIAERIASLVAGQVISFCGKTSFSQLALLIQFARLVITTDSLPLHIGVATGTKTLAIFGPTDPRKHCPPGARYISKRLSCGPCYQKFCVRLDCLKSITPEEVLSQAKVMLYE